MAQTSSTTYSTTDIGLAAFLVARGHPLIQVQLKGQWGTFIFPPKARSDGDDYFRGGMVEGQKFLSALQSLKARTKHAAR